MVLPNGMTLVAWFAVLWRRWSLWWGLLLVPYAAILLWRPVLSVTLPRDWLFWAAYLAAGAIILLVLYLRRLRKASRKPPASG